MNILAAHLNTSRATEMLFTNLELTDIGQQNVVYHIILGIAVIMQKVLYSIVWYSTVHWNTPAGKGTPLYRENSTAHCVTVEEQSSNPIHNIIE